ncbi:hypothetical protein MMC30_005367 [Trapelia coarctata]|nr:hypothetical protein [Trapelia coarctata]
MSGYKWFPQVYDPDATYIPLPAKVRESDEPAVTIPQPSAHPTTIPSTELEAEIRDLSAPITIDESEDELEIPRNLISNDREAYNRMRSSTSSWVPAASRPSNF